MRYLPHSTKIALAAELAAATHVHYVIDFDPAESYAATMAKSIGNATLSSDLTISEDTTNDADGLGTKIAFAGKTLTRTGTAPDPAVTAHDVTLLFVDGSSVKYGIDVTPVEVPAAAPSIVVSASVALIRDPVAL